MVMIPFILSALVAAISVFGAPPDSEGISIQLLNLDRGSPLSKDGPIVPEALARPVYRGAEKEHAKMNNTGPSMSSVSLFKRQNAPLERKGGGNVWAAQIEIGTPPQRFVVLIDTGSSATWVLSSACVAPECSSKNKYDASKSSSSVQQEGEFSVTYGDGRGVSGPVYTDTVAIAGLSAEGQFFSPVNQVNKWGILHTEGLLGLGFKPGSRLKAPTFIETLYSQGKIHKPIFSIRLASGPGSELYIGGTDPSKYTGEITYAPLDDPASTLWMVRGKVSVNGRVGYTGRMVIDSGTTLIRGPHDSVSDWWAKVPGSAPCSAEDCGGLGYFTFPCGNVHSISFSFNGRDFPFPTQDLIRE